MAVGRRRGGACLPLCCPPPRVKAKVIPQPLGEAGLGGSGQTKSRSPGELEARGPHLGPKPSWRRAGRQAPLPPWSHPPGGPALQHQPLWIPEQAWGWRGN